MVVVGGWGGGGGMVGVGLLYSSAKDVADIGPDSELRKGASRCDIDLSGRSDEISGHSGLYTRRMLGVFSMMCVSYWGHLVPIGTLTDMAACIGNT